MTMTDPLADMLTRIRNALKAAHEQVDIPLSNLKENIAILLKEEGHVQNYKVIKDRKQGTLRVFLKYDHNRQGLIKGMERVSKPSRRIYVGKEDIPSVKSGFGVAILSTNRGVITDREAKRLGVGGEVLCRVW